MGVVGCSPKTGFIPFGAPVLPLGVAVALMLLDRLRIPAGERAGQWMRSIMAAPNSSDCVNQRFLCRKGQIFRLPPLGRRVDFWRFRVKVSTHLSGPLSTPPPPRIVTSFKDPLLEQRLAWYSFPTLLGAIKPFHHDLQHNPWQT